MTCFKKKFKKQMLPIRGLIEVINIDLVSSRDQMLKQGFTGLGPPDLVVLKKIDQSTNNSEITSHHVEGFQITSPSSFPAYFARIIQNINDNESFSSSFFSASTSQNSAASNSQQKKSKAKRNWYDQNRVKNITIKEGLYCCWNSFANVDIRIQVSIPGSCTYYCFTPNEESYKVSDLTWRELTICSTLRFWRASTPLFASLFDFNSLAVPCLQYIVPPSLLEDELRFVVSSHPKSSELSDSILHAMIGLKNPPLFFRLLEEFSPKMPHLLSRLFFYVSPKVLPLHKHLLSVLDNVYPCFADDDVNFAFSLVVLRLNNNEIEKTFKSVPLLLSSLWNEPLAGIALARISIALDRAEDALLFLNASSIALCPSWHDKHVWMPNMPVTKPKDTPHSTTNQSERNLFISPLGHSAFYLYRSLAIIARKIGIIRLSSILKFKFISSRVDSVKISLSDDLFPIVEPDDFVDNEDPMLQLLNDPGVENEPIVPAAVKNLPTSQSFLEAAKLVISDMQTLEAIKRGDGNQTYSGGGKPMIDWIAGSVAVKKAVVALKLGDLEFASNCMENATDNTAIAQLIRMRIACETKWTRMEDIFTQDAKKITLNEFNAIIIAQEIACGIDALASYKFQGDVDVEIENESGSKESEYFIGYIDNDE